MLVTANSMKVRFKIALTGSKFFKPFKARISQLE